MSAAAKQVSASGYDLMHIHTAERAADAVALVLSNASRWAAIARAAEHYVEALDRQARAGAPEGIAAAGLEAAKALADLRSAMRVR